MQPSLSSPAFDFVFHPESGTFDLYSRDPRLPGFTGGRMRVDISQPDRKNSLPLDHFEVEYYDEVSHNLGSHGVRGFLETESIFTEYGLRVIIHFALSDSAPLFLWKLRLTNTADDEIKVEKIEFLRVGGQEKFGWLDFPQDDADRQWSFYSNGWQSWSPSSAYLDGEPMRISRLGFLQQPMIINHGTPALRMPGYYTADFFGALADLSSKSGLAAGFLSQKQHFGSIEAVTFDRPSLAIFTSDSAVLVPGASMETDWAVITPIATDDPDPLGNYLDSVAREHGLLEHKFKPVPSGWCSWYHYYSNLKAADIRNNLDSMTRNQNQLPLKLVQIDDGFETSVGDWFSFKPGFPGGVAPLAREIQESGFTPGLWVAPFILDPRSEFFKQHPKLILRNKRGKPVNAGFGWNNLTAAIDLTTPQAMELALEPIHRAVQDWKFPYLKLDFLYAAALQGLRSDPSWTRAQVMRQGMEAIREIVGPNTFLVGCGLPLGSGVGLVDAMRIGADVNGSWEPKMKGIRFPFRDEPAMPSSRNSLHNTLTRAPLHKRWWTNDPDCLLLGEATRLTLPEIQALASGIGITGGSVLLSDNMTSLSTERLRIAQVLLPVIGKRAEVLDLFEQTDPEQLRLPLSGPQGSWTVIAHFNWQDAPQPLTFHPADYALLDRSCWLSSFWDGRLWHDEPGTTVNLPLIPAHGVFLAAVIPIPNDSQPLYLGSNLHFSQGVEVKQWQVEEHKVSLTLDLDRLAEGFFQLFLPSEPTRAECEGNRLKTTSILPGVYRFEVKLDQTARINVWY
ncbi:MAG TPA: glycoside hydrolase family 36 protein [Bellilinea sp.]|nr:glycoside hydrolase family 36 protein [Bellilinea sp.]